MRGSDAMQESLFMMAKLEDFVPSAQSGLDRPARRAASGTQRSLPLRQWKEIQEMLRQHGQTSLIRMRIAKHIVE